MKCGKSRYYQAGSCLEKCPTGWYGHDGTNTCLRCDDNCKTCSGPGKKNCLICAEGRIMDEEGLCTFQWSGCGWVFVFIYLVSVRLGFLEIEINEPSSYASTASIQVSAEIFKIFVMSA